MTTSGKNKKEKQAGSFGLTRREFIRTTAAGTGMICAGPAALAWGGDAKSRVAQVHHPGLVTEKGGLDKAAARQCVDKAVCLLTGRDNTKAAWQTVFPHLKKTDTIGLKVNCINRKCPTHPEISYAVAQSLVDNLGINPNSVIIWDRTESELRKTGYVLNSSDTGVRCLGTVRKFSIPRWVINRKQDETGGIGYDTTQPIDVGQGLTANLTRILTEMCTFLINVPVLKDHRLAGVTLSLKNHYGSIDIPRDCHGDFCDPYIAKINAAPQIREKTKLFLMDAAMGVSEGGPRGAPDFMPQKVLASFDPVALDYTGMTLINARRRDKGEDPVTGMAVHIRTAQSEGLGTCNPENIILKEARLG